MTDEIAPGYSAIIKQPMDLQTMGHKVELNEYPSVSEFKVGFAEERVLLWSMCVCVCVCVSDFSKFSERVKRIRIYW